MYYTSGAYLVQVQTSKQELENNKKQIDESDESSPIASQPNILINCHEVQNFIFVTKFKAKHNSNLPSC